MGPENKKNSERRPLKFRAYLEIYKEDSTTLLDINENLRTKNDGNITRKQHAGRETERGAAADLSRAAAKRELYAVDVLDLHGQHVPRLPLRARFNLLHSHLGRARFVRRLSALDDAAGNVRDFWRRHVSLGLHVVRRPTAMESLRAQREEEQNSTRDAARRLLNPNLLYLF